MVPHALFRRTFRLWTFKTRGRVTKQCNDKQTLAALYGGRRRRRELSTHCHSVWKPTRRTAYPASPLRRVRWSYTDGHGTVRRKNCSVLSSQSAHAETWLTESKVSPQKVCSVCGSQSPNRGEGFCNISAERENTFYAIKTGAAHAAESRFKFPNLPATRQ